MKSQKPPGTFVPGDWQIQEQNSLIFSLTEHTQEKGDAYA